MDDVGVVSCFGVSKMNLICWSWVLGNKARLNAPDWTERGTRPRKGEHFELVRPKHVIESPRRSKQDTAICCRKGIGEAVGRMKVYHGEGALSHTKGASQDRDLT